MYTLKTTRPCSHILYLPRMGTFQLLVVSGGDGERERKGEMVTVELPNEGHTCTMKSEDES